MHKVNIKGSETIIDNRFFQLGEKSQHGSSRWATQPHSPMAVFPIVKSDSSVAKWVVFIRPWSYIRPFDQIGRFLVVFLT